VSGAIFVEKLAVFRHKNLVVIVSFGRFSIYEIIAARVVCFVLARFGGREPTEYGVLMRSDGDVAML